MPVHDRTNIRELTPELIGGPVDLVVGDLSFISPRSWCSTPLLGVTAPDGDLALMVKPQFEVGKDRVGKGGVVRDPELRAEAVPRRGRRRPPRAAGAPGWWRPARCPGRRATWSSSCGCATGRPTIDADDIHRVVRAADPAGGPG